MLVTLLLPAVQAAREAARRTQCTNQVKQLSLAALNHESSHGAFPTGGWGKEWSADPNRGFGADQPGSWLFNIMPYIEFGNVYDIMKGLDPGSDAYLAASNRMHETAVPNYYCPTRREPNLYRGEWTRCYNSNAPNLKAFAKNDYAANAGDGRENSGDRYAIPNTYDRGDHPQYEWSMTNDPTSRLYCSGVVYYRSEVTIAKISDGTSKTIFAGEKYLRPEAYAYTMPSFGDNQSMYTGFEWDNTRLTRHVPGDPNSEVYLPRQDRIGYGNVRAFGSAHAGGFVATLCDGSARTISYDVDPEAYRRFGNRHDGLPVDLGTF